MHHIRSYFEHQQANLYSAQICKSTAEQHKRGRYKPNWLWHSSWSISPMCVSLWLTKRCKQSHHSRHFPSGTVQDAPRRTKGVTKRRFWFRSWNPGHQHSGSQLETGSKIHVTRILLTLGTGTTGSTSGPVSTEMDDRLRVQFPVPDTYFGM